MFYNGDNKTQKVKVILLQFPGELVPQLTFSGLFPLNYSPPGWGRGAQMRKWIIE